MKIMRNIGKILVGLLLGIFLSTVAYAAEEEVEVVVDGGNAEEVLEEDVPCSINLPETRLYDSEVISVRRKLKVQQGEEFDVKVFLKNKGNMPWFNGDYCSGPWAYLGTERTRDRASVFYAEGLDGWKGNNRIEMDQPRVNPGQIASFTFTAKAPETNDFYKEYFALTMKDLLWVGDSTFDIDVIVGNPANTAIELREMISYAGSSGPVSAINLNAPRKVIVDRGNQQLYLYLGETLVRQFPVSTGAAATPTPLGTTTITLKQQVRVGGAAPHYIMPKFMWFRAGGYGFHALPKLKGNGWFWEEALDHIGIAVSHGCVRLLPADADWMFEFVQIGTEVTVVNSWET